MKVTLILFIPPNGRQEPVGLEISDEWRDKYFKLDEELGMRFTMESNRILVDVVSVCIEHPQHGDFAIEMITIKHPDLSCEDCLRRGVEKMLAKFDPAAAKRWIKQMEKL